MKIIKCDFCNADLPEEDLLRREIISIKASAQAYDVCDNCYNKIVNFVKYTLKKDNME